MTINSISELIEHLKARQNKYGIIGGLNPDKEADLFKFLVKLGVAEEYRTPKGFKKRRLLVAQFNDFLAKYDMYCEVKGVDVDKTMLEYLTRFGAVKDGVLDYHRVFSPNERVRIEAGDPLALEQKAMRKKLTRLATLSGKTSLEYIEENLGLTIEYSDVGRKYGHSAEDAKQAVVDFVSKKKLSDGKVKLTKGEKSTLSYMLKYHKVDSIDDSLSPIVDVMFNDMGVSSNSQYRERVDNVYDTLVEEILAMWPDKVISQVTSEDCIALYNRMRNYYYNMPHDESESFSDYWSHIFATDTRLLGYSFARTNDSERRLEKRQALVLRALTTNAIYIAEDGTKHMKGIYSDRKNYNILRKEALLRGMTLAQYLLQEHGIVLDMPKSDTLQVNTSRLRDSSKYEKKTEPVDESLDDKGSM